jgi:hypothetical protein
MYFPKITTIYTNLVLWIFFYCISPDKFQTVINNVKTSLSHSDQDNMKTTAKDLIVELWIFQI